MDGRKVIAETSDRAYVIKKTLKEVEEDIVGNGFVRISKSEVVNLDKVKHFDFSLSGTIGLELENGACTYVSRRRIKDVKEALDGGTDHES